METETWAVVAAFAAAAFSFINVVATGRMAARVENQKWVRDLAQPHIVNTLKISYALRINLELTMKQMREFDGTIQDDPTLSIEERHERVTTYVVSLEEFKQSILANLSEVSSQVTQMQEFIIELEFLADQYLMGRLSGLFDLHNLLAKHVGLEVTAIGTGPSTEGPSSTEKKLVSKIIKHEEKLRRAAHRQYGSEATVVRFASFMRAKSTAIVRRYNKWALK